MRGRPIRNHCLIRRIDTAGSISNFAGTGICGFNGDGKQALSTMLSNPFGIAFDGHGNLLVADQTNLRVRKISPAGIVSTIAGNGKFGYSGDNGPATEARLSQLTGVSTDPAGNLYIADSGNYAVRMVDTAGVIHTVAGNRTYGYSGDGGPATSAQIGNVQSVVADSSGGFYIAESTQHIRKVDSAGVISTYAGNGFNGNSGSGGPAPAASIGYPFGLLLSGGQLYISTISSIWSVDLNTQIITLVAGNNLAGFGGEGASALVATFNQPWGMASNSAGDLFVSDSANGRLREIVPSTQVVNTIAGGYIGDGHRGPDAALNFNFGGHIAFDAAGNLFIADTFDQRVRKVSPNGQITTLAGTGTSGYSGDNGPASQAQLDRPTAVAIDGSGNVFIADSGNGVLRKVDNSGVITTFARPGFSGLAGPLPSLAVDSHDNVYASDGLWAVWKIDPAGNSVVVAGTLFNIGYNGDGMPATQAWLSLPGGVAVDGAGNLYIADWLNNRIRKVDTNGIISTIAGNGTFGFFGDGGPATAAGLSLPLDVAVDSSGNVYIADWSNLRIRIVDSSGTIKTFAGSGFFGYNGNQLPALRTNMFPIALAVGQNGAIYFSDSNSYRVRKIQH